MTRVGSISFSAEQPILLRVDEVAVLLRTTRKAVYTSFERGLIPGGVRIGRRLLFDRERLVEWLREKSAASSKGVDRR